MPFRECKIWHRPFGSALLILSYGLAFVATSANGQVPDVRPIDWSKIANGPAIQPGDEFGRKLVQLMQLHSRYVLAEIDRDYKSFKDLPEFPDVEYYYPFGRRDASTEHSIRPLGDLAYGVAVMLKTGTYSAEVAKVDVAESLRRTELAIRGIAFTHRANRKTGRTWGGRGSDRNRWQAAYWASLAGQSAWMLWDDLSDEHARRRRDDDRVRGR